MRHMRASDQKLHDDLAAAGLPGMAMRAANGEWNDYFSQNHVMPQHALVAELREQRPMTDAIQAIIADTIEGKYDGTPEESEEWARSAEGQAAFRSLTER